MMMMILRVKMRGAESYGRQIGRTRIAKRRSIVFTVAVIVVVGGGGRLLDQLKRATCMKWRMS
jgi:hypothetical protein